MDRERLRSLISDEREKFARKHPRSQSLFEAASRNLLAGVPMSWMAKWPGGNPIFAADARGARATPGPWRDTLPRRRRRRSPVGIAAGPR